MSTSTTSSSSPSPSPVRVTDTPAIKNAPLVGLAEGNGYFSNLQLAALVVLVPWLVKRTLPLVRHGGAPTYLVLLVLLGAPVAAAYWALASTYGPRRNTKVALPGKNIEAYLTVHDRDLRRAYRLREKIPMQVFHDAYFDKKIDFNGAPASYPRLF